MYGLRGFVSASGIVLIYEGVVHVGLDCLRVAMEGFLGFRSGTHAVLVIICDSCYRGWHDSGAGV